MTSFKEEYSDYDQTIKMVKKEEHSYMKLEEKPSNPAAYNHYIPESPLIPLHWRQLAMQLPIWPLGFNIQHLRQFYFNKGFPCSSFGMAKEVTLEQAPSTCSPSPAKVENQIEIKVSQRKPRKKSLRVSACKNYIGLLCAGFSRVLLTAKKDSSFYNHLEALLLERNPKFEVLEDRGDEELIECFRKHIYTTMCGKKVKKQDRERDFKIRNTQELDSLLVIKEEDSPLTRLRKEVLQEMVKYFFNSEYYYQWLSNGMMSETNRVFFLQNKVELQKKFLSPSLYKPHFKHVLSY